MTGFVEWLDRRTRELTQRQTQALNEIRALCDDQEVTPGLTALVSTRRIREILNRTGV